jgi:hypothetical protein
VALAAPAARALDGIPRKIGGKLTQIKPFGEAPLCVDHCAA